MKSIDKKPLPWSALLTSLKSQVNFAKALFGVSLMAALVLGLTTYFTLLGRNHTRDVLIQTATSTVSASCYATRELIDAELVFSLKKPEDAIAQADSYQHTLIDITNLKYSINAERIYVVRRLGTEYLIVWDTDSANARAFTNVELNDIQIEAFTGTFSLEIHNPGDMSASLNNGALPLFYHSEVIAVVCVDFSTQYVNEADNTTSFLVYMLIGSVATMMSVLFVVALILFKQNQRNQQQLFDMANQDIVTGLPNRRYLFSYLYDRIENPVSTKRDVPIIAIFIDLDDFKAVNDGAGHDVGDQLLNIIGKLLSSTINSLAARKKRDCLTARLGGDEFVQLLADSDLGEAVAYLKTLMQAFMAMPELQEYINDYDINFSAGIAAYPFHTTDYNDLVKYADIAMYYSKKRGKQTYTIYDPGMGDFIEGVTLSVREVRNRS